MMIFSGNLLDPRRGMYPTAEFVMAALVHTETEEHRMRLLLIESMSPFARRCIEIGLMSARRQLDGLSELYAKVRVYMN